MHQMKLKTLSFIINTEKLLQNQFEAINAI